MKTIFGVRSGLAPFGTLEGGEEICLEVVRWGCVPRAEGLYLYIGLYGSIACNHTRTTARRGAVGTSQGRECGERMDALPMPLQSASGSELS
jgi:hypothetical protein